MLKLIARLELSSVVWGAIGLLSAAQAQIVRDTTLPINSEVLTTGNDATIRGGTQVGGNLFHSFERFSVPTNGSAFFDNASTVQNIISRVTGALPSSIDGTIRANGNANLFLINPNGISFGTNAQLRIGGSLVASTANGLQFGDRGFFNATNPNFPSPLLTINPSALLFNQIKPAPIQNNSISDAGVDPVGRSGYFGLRVENGRSLLLVGGDINHDRGGLVAFGGHIDLGAVAGTGTIGLSFEGENPRLSFPNNVPRGDISLTNDSGFIVAGSGGGSITLVGRNISILAGSAITGGILQGVATGDSTQAGDITVNATGELQLGELSRLVNNVNLNSTGNAGNLWITASSLMMSGGTLVSTNTLGQGNAGNINIQISNQMMLTGSYVVSNVQADAIGNGGIVNVKAGSITAQDGGQINTFNRGQGKAGRVVLEANSITFKGVDSDGFPSGIFNDLESTGKGQGGDIQIKTNSLALQNGAFIRSSTSGQGDAGKIVLDVGDKLSLFGQGRSNITNDVNTGGIGNSGGISIKTGSLYMSDLALITSDVDGQGNSGDIEIEARDFVSLEQPGRLTLAGEPGTLILSRVNDGAIGNGGDIKIKTGSLFLSNAQITTSTSSKGNSGSVIIEARDQVTLLRGTDIFTEVTCACETQSGKGGDGKGGDIRITTGSVFLDGGSNLRADTEAKGDAGNIIINARNSVTFAGSSDEFTSGAFSQVEPDAVGRGGDIQITTGTLSLSGDQEINTRTQGQGNAGNISIQANSISLSDPEVRIISNVSNQDRLEGTTGNGGNITISTGSLMMTNGSRLLANTEAQGKAGDVMVSARDRIVLDSSEISVASQGSSQAGNLTLTTPNLALKNQGMISAASAAIDGGNVTLNIRDLLLLRRNSNISASAGINQGAGNGGNIVLNAPNGLLLALPGEDSNINADAFTGKGGNVQISVQGIYGIEPRSGQTNLSDITASSQFGISGNVALNTPDVDPSRGTIELPATVLDRSNQIAQTCAPQKVVASSFVNSGRGSLPPSPLDTLQGESGTFELASVETTPDRENRSDRISALPTDHLIEAQGWIKDAQGKVTLVANANTPASYPSTLGRCH